MKVKLFATVTITQEYEADSQHYGNCDYATDMIAIDKANFKNDPYLFIDGMLESGGKSTIKIKKITSQCRRAPKAGPPDQHVVLWRNNMDQILKFLADIHLPPAELEHHGVVVRIPVNIIKKAKELAQQEDSTNPEIIGYCCSRCFKVYKLWEDSAKCCEGC